MSNTFLSVFNNVLFPDISGFENIELELYNWINCPLSPPLLPDIFHTASFVFSSQIWLKAPKIRSQQMREHD